MEAGFTCAGIGTGSRGAAPPTLIGLSSQTPQPLQPPPPTPTTSPPPALAPSASGGASPMLPDPFGSRGRAIWRRWGSARFGGAPATAQDGSLPRPAICRAGRLGSIPPPTTLLRGTTLPCIAAALRQGRAPLSHGGPTGR
ncbi:unnamed protein product [Urochloa humidicola]